MSQLTLSLKPVLDSIGSLDLTAFPVSKRTKFEDKLARFEMLNESSNWHQVEYDEWKLPGTEEPHYWCGTWATKGCLNVSQHGKKISSISRGKIFIKRYQKFCYRASCKTCKRKWMAREANKATRRIETYQKKSRMPPKHIIVSPPEWEKFKPLKDFKNDGKNELGLRKKASKILKELKAKGGTIIYHPFRFNKEYREWYPSPHFHVIGFGWIDDATELFKKSGWIVKNLGVRDSVFATFYYQLSHAGIKKRNHTLVWFGDLSYSKLPIEKEPDLNKCPVCQEGLVDLNYILSDFRPPDTEFEMWVSPKGWKDVTPEYNFSNSKPRPPRRVC